MSALDAERKINLSVINLSPLLPEIRKTPEFCWDLRPTFATSKSEPSDCQNQHSAFVREVVHFRSFEPTGPSKSPRNRPVRSWLPILD
jgi:hypothetical protein